MIERGKDDSLLQFAVKWHAEVVAHHERNEQSARRLAVLRHVAGHRD